MKGHVFMKNIATFTRILVLGLALGMSAQAGGAYDTKVAEVKVLLAERDQTLRSLLQILHAVQIEQQRLEVRIQFYNSKHELKDGTVLHKLKPEQPQTDAFIQSWALKNDYVVAQARQILPYLRLPAGSNAKALLVKSEADEATLLNELVLAKKKDGSYAEAVDVPAMRVLLADVRLQYSRPADVSKYLNDKVLIDRLLELRKKKFFTPVDLSKTVLEIVKNESASWSVQTMKKTLFFVPVKKYFWEVVGLIEDRQGTPMNWVMSEKLRGNNPALYDQLLAWAKAMANQPVKLGKTIYDYVKANPSLTQDELEVCLHFTPDSSYANKILNLIHNGAGIGLAGFYPSGREIPTLSSSSTTRFVDMNGSLVGLFQQNPKGNPGHDWYFDANSSLVLTRQGNTQGGERWFTPYRPFNVVGDNGAFVFNYFDPSGAPVGFARRSELTSTLYFYDLEANLIGVSRTVNGTTTTETLYAGDFYVYY